MSGNNRGLHNNFKSYSRVFITVMRNRKCLEIIRKQCHKFVGNKTLSNAFCI